MKYDDVIFASLGKPIYYETQRLGIELEFEQMHDDYPQLEWWRCEHDPSLRDGGIEFISAPLADEDRAEALDEACNYADGAGIVATDRCGVHIHMNVSFWTWRDLFRYLVLYSLAEPYIFHQFADGREDNHFCVPVTLNERLVDQIATDAVTLRAGRGIFDKPTMLGCSKYSALNLNPVQRLGTIEFRHLQGTGDAQVIDSWCRMLQKIQEVASEYEDPANIIQEYEDMGVAFLLDRIGCHTCDIPEWWAEESYIAASMMVGYEEPKWQDMDWTMPKWKEENMVQGHEPRMVIMDEVMDLDEMHEVRAAMQEAMAELEEER